MELISLIRESLPDLFNGLMVTLELTVLSLFIAVIIGLIAGFMRLSKNRVLSTLSRWYVNIIRGTPLLVQILYVYFGIPMITGIRMTAFTASIITMSIYSGAYISEIFRSGILSIDPGQLEGGLSLGFTKAQTMRKIILPQAIRNTLPTFVNQFTMTLKDTSLLSTIGVTELTFRGKAIYSANFRTFEVLTMVAVLYFVIVYALTRFSLYLERRMAV